jgi:hypothetical protein
MMKLTSFASVLLATSLFACAAPSSSPSSGDDESVEVTDEALVSSNREFIEAVADDIGEYFHYEASAYAANIVPVPISKLPAALRAKAEARALDEAESVRSGNGNGDAFLGDEAYKIVRSGRTVGYVIPIEHAIDHPLWDGSGVHVYYDTRRTIVVEVPWTG